MTPGSAGLQAIIDPQTGGVVKATAEQLGQLSALSKNAGGAATQSQPREGEIVQLPGGGEMVRVPERFMMNAVAHRDANGKVTYDCRQSSGPIAPAPEKAPAAAESAPWEVK